jgi:hypothetical protein
MRPRCHELHRVLKKTGSFYYHCDWHASHYVKVPLDPSYVESHYSQVDETGRRFQWGDLRAPGGAAPSKGNPHYKVLGVEGYWRYSQERMEQFIREGRVAIPPKGKTPRFKRYLDESKGLPVGSVWDDINPINSQARESLGYPTQKPLRCWKGSSTRAAKK